MIRTLLHEMRVVAVAGIAAAAAVALSPLGTALYTNLPFNQFFVAALAVAGIVAAYAAYQLLRHRVSAQAALIY